MNFIKSKALVFLIIAIGCFYGGYKAADVNIIKSVGIEREVIEKDGETRTIYRYLNKKEKTVVPNNRRWTGRVLIDPSRPDRGEIGVGYRVFKNFSLEGSYRPSGDNRLMLGFGVSF